MHHAVIDHHIRAENMTDALMAETNAERGNGGAEGADDFVREAGLVGRTRAGRNQDAIRLQRAHLFHREVK